MDHMSYQGDDLTGIRKDESKTSGVYLEKEKRRKFSYLFLSEEKKGG